MLFLAFAGGLILFSLAPAVGDVPALDALCLIGELRGFENDVIRAVALRNLWHASDDVALLGVAHDFSESTGSDQSAHVDALEHHQQRRSAINISSILQAARFARFEVMTEQVKLGGRPNLASFINDFPMYHSFSPARRLFSQNNFLSWSNRAHGLSRCAQMHREEAARRRREPRTLLVQRFDLVPIEPLPSPDFFLTSTIYLYSDWLLAGPWALLERAASALLDYLSAADKLDAAIREAAKHAFVPWLMSACADNASEARILSFRPHACLTWAARFRSEAVTSEEAEQAWFAQCQLLAGAHNSAAFDNASSLLAFMGAQVLSQALSPLLGNRQCSLIARYKRPDRCDQLELDACSRAIADAHNYDGGEQRALRRQKIPHECWLRERNYFCGRNGRSLPLAP